MNNNKSILVTGAGGQLGSSLKLLMPENKNLKIYFADKKALNITDFNLTKILLKKFKINTVINCAAFTDVNRAENNKNLVDSINHKSVENLAILCRKKNINLIQISTDYIFDGLKQSPYLETDNPNPLNYYGLTKLKAERKILDLGLNNSFIIRTSWLYSKSKNNFISKIIDSILDEKLCKVVDDEFGSPTNSEDLASAIYKIILKPKNDKTQIYNFSNLGVCSRYELACEIGSFFGKKHLIHPVASKNKEVKRPKYSALDSSKISDEYKIKIDLWRDSLQKHLNKTFSAF